MLFLCVLLFATSSLAAGLNDYDVGNRTKRGRWLKFKINLLLQQQNSLSMQVLPSMTPHRSARYGTTVGSGQLIRLFWLAPFKRRRYVREGREIWFMYKIRAYQAEQGRIARIHTFWFNFHLNSCARMRSVFLKPQNDKRLTRQCKPFERTARSDTPCFS